MSSHARGRWAEDLVQRKFENDGWKTLAIREKLKYGEVDFIFQKFRRKYLIEVKYLHNDWMSFERLNDLQIRTLRLNKIFLEKQSPLYIYRNFICFVSANGHTKFLDADEI